MARSLKASEPATPKVAMHIDDLVSALPTVIGEPEPLVNKPMPRNLRHTETVTTHYFPGLLPFGTVQLRIVRHDRWTIKCGSIRMSGWGGEVDEIVKAFVAKVKLEIGYIANEVESSEFTTEPKVY